MGMDRRMVPGVGKESEGVLLGTGWEDRMNNEDDAGDLDDGKRGAIKNGRREHSLSFTTGPGSDKSLINLPNDHHGGIR